jgi:hypothetical protein
MDKGDEAMKDERIIEEMARLEFGEKVRNITHSNRGVFIFCDNTSPSFREYLDDHNAVQRVIDGLSGRYSVRNGEYHEFLYQADCVASRDFYKSEHDETFIGMDHIPLMTPRQKCEAILKAKGLWEE